MAVTIQKLERKRCLAFLTEGQSGVQDSEERCELCNVTVRHNCHLSASRVAKKMLLRLPPPLTRREAERSGLIVQMSSVATKSANLRPTSRHPAYP